MSIKIFWPWELPKILNGTVVITDIYAATTNIVTFLTQGVKKLFIVSEKNASQVRKKFPDAFIVGESLKLPKNFFDVSNLPHNIHNFDFKEKTILYTTTNGAKVIRLAVKKGASQILTVSFLNINSVASYLEVSKEKTITIIPAGEIGEPCQEDLICAESLKDILQGKEIDWKKRLMSAEKFIKSFYKPKYNNLDLKIMFDLNKYQAVPLCSLGEKGLITISDLR